jgi:protein TonB
VCRWIVAEISAPADQSARLKARNNSTIVGVYIGVFEQSILIDNRPNKSWSLLASVSAELVVVSILILVPLIYGDRLPEFHLHTVTVGPPIRQAHVEPTPAQQSSGAARPMFHRPQLIPNPIPATQATPAASSAVYLDVPGLPAGGTEGTAPGPALFGGAIDVVPPKPTPVPVPAHTDPVRVSIGVQMAKLVKQVMPVYPHIAKIAGVSGVVHLVGIISKDGTIRNLQLISGHPLLTQAALDAVAQWIYKPTLLSGEPVEVICPIDVNFTLSK